MKRPLSRTRKLGRRRGPRLVALAAAVALFAAGCRDQIPSTGPDAGGPPAPSFGLQEVSEKETPSQDEVAGAVPGFAGYFLDDDVPTVYLTDPTERATAEDALAGWLSSRGFTESDLEVREADYDWSQLQEWYEAAWPDALSVDGAVLSDVDEGHNRLRFGGADAGAVAAMRDAVLAAGVPSEAFEVDEVSPIERVTNLRDRVRPVPGGYQINFLKVGDVVTVSLICTLGFNAVPEGPEHEPNPSFITNSHCSNTEGDGAENPAEYYQPLQDPDDDGLAEEKNFIGTEVDDPVAKVTPDCPLAIPCRWSDAARAEYAGDVPFELGEIARTASFDPLRGTLEVDDSNPTFEIKEEQPFAVLGEFANKVGRTTGWTGGEITGTCVNVIAIGGVFLRRCQAEVAGGVDSGDSGSPVFLSRSRRNRVRGDKVVLNGILWGGNTEGTEFIYSPTFNIERELGKLQTH